eukprot:1153871-Pelagomonas_calceolata.AAC.2
MCVLVHGVCVVGIRMMVRVRLNKQRQRAQRMAGLFATFEALAAAAAAAAAAAVRMMGVPEEWWGQDGWLSDLRYERCWLGWRARPVAVAVAAAADAAWTHVGYWPQPCRCCPTQRRTAGMGPAQRLAHGRLHAKGKESGVKERPTWHLPSGCSTSALSSWNKAWPVKGRLEGWHMASQTHNWFGVPARLHSTAACQWSI